MKIIVDPRSDYTYSTFYIYGLIQYAGKDSIKFSVRKFRELRTPSSNLRFIIQNDKEQKKYSIQTNDSYQIIDSDYEWCDVYGCVNANFSHYPPEQFEKLVSLAPSFAIRIEEGNALKVIINACLKMIPILPYILSGKEWNKEKYKMERRPLKLLKHYISRRYKVWKNRLPISAYGSDVNSEDNYVFFLSTLWYSNEWNNNDKGVNLRRACFIRACKSIENCRFEGGLLGDDYSSNQIFADVVTFQGLSFPDWIEKTKQSSLVFNTPAFWDCHGWKLGEYLALGKCIISTPLSNDLPFPLEHGVNIHFVDASESSMKTAVEYILSHPDYRHRLEIGARSYWEKYGNPQASLFLLGIR